MTVKGLRAENVELRAEIKRLDDTIDRLRAVLLKAVQDMDRLTFTPDWLDEARALTGAKKEPREKLSDFSFADFEEQEPRT